MRASFGGACNVPAAWHNTPNKEPLMHDEEAFLRAIEEKPDDLARRLVYADWLEERGDPRARYLRLECQLLQIPAMIQLLQAQAAEIPGQLTQLQQQLDPHWLARLSPAWSVTLRGYEFQKKIMVIKLIREVTNCGLAEAKDLSEKLPARLAEGVTLQQANAMQRRFANDARVTIERFPATISAPRSSETGHYRVVLVSFPHAMKLETIRIIRGMLGLGLREAKDFVESAPQTIREHLRMDEAEALRRPFDGVATVTIERMG